MCNKNLAAWTRKALAAAMAAALTFTMAWGGMGAVILVHAEEAKSQGNLNVTYHSQAEISARIKSDGVSTDDPLHYAVEPQSVPPYNAGALAPDTLNNAMKMMNQIRYIAGLSDNVTLNEEYNRKAQAAALVNLANRQLSHYPTRPAGMDDALYNLGYSGSSSSNIAMASWNCSLNWTIVHGWMEDGDANNIDRVGHRRWILNPSMGQTGFGAAYGIGGTYSALYCFDRSNSSATQTQVAWPAQNMPVQYFGTEFPWSVSMGYSVDRNSVQVSLRRVNDGMTWNFSAGGSDGYFNVDNGGYGQKGCIIFRPDGVGKYQAGDTFAVTITGGGVNLFYTVNFFDPDNVQPEETIREVDWAAVDALSDSVPEGGAVDILAGCRFTVPVETLNKLAGRNILCAFHIDSDLVLSISGAAVTPSVTPWNVIVTYKTAIPEALLMQIKENAEATRVFDLANTGEFPAPVNVHIGWGTDKAGKQASLYCYDDTTGVLSEVGRFTVTGDGQSVFTISGSGRHYIAVVQK